MANEAPMSIDGQVRHALATLAFFGELFILALLGCAGAEHGDTLEEKPNDVALNEAMRTMSERSSDESFGGTFDVPPGIPLSVTPAEIKPEHLPVLKRILEHALLSEENESIIKFYSQGSKWVLLQSFGSPLEWPPDFSPEIGDYKFRRSRDDIPAKIALGVDLREFAPLTEDDRWTLFYLGAELNKWKVVLVIYNAKGAPIIGGQRTYYELDPKTLLFEYRGAED
jgi:hypothetical protein